MRKPAKKKAATNRPRNAFYAQSGGVTAVINASAAGVIDGARVHRALGGEAQRRATRDGRAQQVARGNLRNAEALHQALGLRAFAGARGSQENDAHETRCCR